MEDGYNHEVEAIRLAEYPHMNNGIYNLFLKGGKFRHDD
jgi:hypothetical protein